MLFRSLAIVAPVACAAHCSTTIGLESGETMCLHVVNTTTRPLLSKRTAASSASVSMEDCFRSYCSSDAAINAVREAAKSRGYSGWDKIDYHATYFNDGDTYTYQWTDGQVQYDMSKRVDSDQHNVVVYTSSQNNPTDSTASMTFTQQVANGVTMSWSSEQSYSFTDGVSTSVSVKFPEIADVSTTISFSETWSLKEGTTKTSSTTQTNSISNQLPIDAHHCARGCAIGSNAKVEVPYKLSGRFTTTNKAYYGPDDTLVPGAGAICCYLRPGGSNECPTMGHNHGGTGGWYIAPSPGYAASAASCPNLAASGDDAMFSQDGIWSAGVDLSVDVNEVQGPEGQCPDESQCLVKYAREHPAGLMI